MPEQAQEIEYVLRRERRLRSSATRQAEGGPTAPLARITQLMALAIKLDGMLRAGVFHDYTELARLGHVSRARVSQILSLSQLAPDIQEQLLFLPAAERGRDSMTEPLLRKVAQLYDWDEQRRLFRQRVRPRHG